MPKPVPSAIDDYLATLPEQSRGIIGEIRQRIAVAAPEAHEAIKYGMPTAIVGGNSIIYYAAWKKHIGIYPVYRGSPEFETVLEPYRDKKDTVRFMLNKPVPYEIIDLILETRLQRIRKGDGLEG